MAPCLPSDVLTPVLLTFMRSHGGSRIVRRKRRKLWVANSQSSGNRGLKQTAAMLPPSVTIKRGRSRGRCAGALRGRRAIERAVDAMRVVIIREFAQLPRQVHGVPEEYAIEVLAPDRSDQPFDERMRDRSVRNRLDLLDLEDAQVGEPAVKAKQRVVVGTERVSAGAGQRRRD